MYLPVSLGMLSPMLAGMMHFRRRVMVRQKEYNRCTKQESCSECQTNDFCKAWVDFVRLHNDVKRYSHFDKRVSLAMPSIRRYVLDSERITAHSFYPFIHFKKKNSRYGKKGPKKPRNLYYCSHLDRCVYQRYAFLINQKYNKRIKGTLTDEAAIAYRDNLGKNNIDFAKEAFDAIKEKGHSLVIVGDFTDFFDRLDHKYLKDMLCDLLEVKKLPNDYFAVFKNITRFASWDWKLLVEQSGHQITERGIRTKLNKQETILTKAQFQRYKASIMKNNSQMGIPQGSPISAVLSNVYMIKFDKEISNYVTEANGVYMRYSDDFLLVLPYESEIKIQEHKNFINSQVDKIQGLDLQKEKTATYIYNNSSVVAFPDNKPAEIDYLGFIFDGTNIKLRPKSITKYYYRMYRKASNIGCNNWRSPKGKRISAKNLYNIYSCNGELQTFIDYAKKARSRLELNDKEAEALIKHHKRKIAHAIKRGQK